VNLVKFGKLNWRFESSVFRRKHVGLTFAIPISSVIGSAMGHTETAHVGGSIILSYIFESVER
jgi:hypothetical protein